MGKKKKEDKAQNAYKQLMVTRLASANRVFCRIALALPISCSWLCWTHVAWGFPTPSPAPLQHISGLLIYRICSSVWVQDSDITRNTWCKVRIWRAFLHLSRALCSQRVVPPRASPRGTSLRLHGAQPQIHSASTTDGSLHWGETWRLNSALRDDEVHKFKSTSLRVKRSS